MCEYCQVLCCATTTLAKYATSARRFEACPVNLSSCTRTAWCGDVLHCIPGLQCQTAICNPNLES